MDTSFNGKAFLATDSSRPKDSFRQDLVLELASFIDFLNEDGTPIVPIISEYMSDTEIQEKAFEILLDNAHFLDRSPEEGWSQDNFVFLLSIYIFL